ncbi:UDP-glycosyltransferase 89A2 [Ziziphus jujuba]|uniref:Glycosyltransferase n=1 Tax=Ziziphus jujuba TaxID=326968 RepID=A0A6P4AIJ9_ZIZJJ|nr:UDP-glycosyltransferase 89A2 [Ziziphus jujuba]
MGVEIFVVTGSGQGHLNPCMELCKHLTSRNYHTTLVAPSIVSSAIPFSFTQNPCTSTVHVAGSSGPPVPGQDPMRQQASQDLETHLASRLSKESTHPLCAIIDFQMSWSKEVFWKFNIPVVGFFTFGACAAAMEWGAWKVQAADIKPGELRIISGLPEEMAFEHLDLKRRPEGPPPGGFQLGGPHAAGSNRPTRRGGAPKPGDRPPWVPEIEGSVALMFNTCDDLERTFIDYMSNQMGLPAWGVGPLLPEEYWISSSSESLIRDRQIREHKRQSNYREEHVIQWLDAKPRGSVLYVAFGSEVGPSKDEYPQLASALEESTRPFIWVIQSGSGIPGSTKEVYFPDGLDRKVGERGLIICGWGPQLLILSHPSTGGFLSHCGWNSTVEAFGLGVPLLAWPFRGDQYYNAKWLIKHLKVGHRVCEDSSQMVTKDDISRGIEVIMEDEEIKKKAGALRGKLAHGFPQSSEDALDAFEHFISQSKVLHK